MGQSSRRRTQSSERLLLLRSSSVIADLDHSDRVAQVQASLAADARGQVPLLSTSKNLDRYFVLQQPVRLLPPASQPASQSGTQAAFAHNRELFLFSDLLLLTELPAAAGYRFCTLLLLQGLSVRRVTHTTAAPVFAVQVLRQADQQPLLLLQSREEKARDRVFVELREAIRETATTDAELRLLRVSEGEG